MTYSRRCSLEWVAEWAAQDEDMEEGVVAMDSLEDSQWVAEEVVLKGSLSSSDERYIPRKTRSYSSQVQIIAVTSIIRPFL